MRQVLLAVATAAVLGVASGAQAVEMVPARAGATGANDAAAGAAPGTSPAAGDPSDPYGMPDGALVFDRITSVAGDPVLTAMSHLPEPVDWMLMIGGFGLAGAIMRLRRKVSFRA
jgi:hypothetical protein